MRGSRISREHGSSNDELATTPYRFLEQFASVLISRRFISKLNNDTPAWNNVGNGNSVFINSTRSSLNKKSLIKKLFHRHAVWKISPEQGALEIEEGKYINGRQKSNEEWKNGGSTRSKTFSKELKRIKKIRWTYQLVLNELIARIRDPRNRTRNFETRIEL